MSVVCPAENVLDAYASGRLAAAAAGDVETHLDSCDECLRVVAALLATEEVRPPLPPDSLLSSLGRYRLLGVLGEGGMGRVYRAYDPQLDRQVALKVLRRDHLADPIARARMVQEARAMARIAHPNIVTVFDAGEIEGTAFIAMELIVGTTLSRWLETERPVTDVVRAYLAAGDALAAAHDRGVVHRDFKPSNVLVDEAGRVAVTDFGLAWAEESVAVLASSTPAPWAGPTSSPTKTGTLMGTPAFMSPEQYQRARVDARSDQFSFAVALYGALFGRPPFLPRTFEESSSKGGWKWRSVDPALRKRVPPRLSAALRRALSFDPGDRFEDMRALLNELRESMARRRRVPALLAGASAVVAVMVAVIAGRYVPRKSVASPAPPPTPTVLTLRNAPLPASGNAEALATYREALAAQHDGSKGAYKLFREAAAKDPTLAAAYLHHTMLELSTEDPDRQAASLDSFRHAMSGRDRLSPRDRALADALAPALLGQPADWDTCEERLRAEALRSPTDQNLWSTLGQALTARGKVREAEDAFTKAIELDPSDIGTRALLASAEQVQGDLTAASQTAAACLAESPQATRCIGVLFSVRSIEGKCRETEALSQRLITVSPDDTWGYLDLAESELALEEPDETVKATEERLVRAMDPGSRAWASLHFPWLRAVLEGDFGRANELMDEEHALAVRAGILGDQLRALFDIAKVRLETGDVAAAGRAADAYVKRKQALAAPSYATRNVVARDHVPEMLAVMQRAGLLSPVERQKRRDAWVAEWDARLQGREGPFLWLEAFALPAETREDAEEALAHAPKDLAPLLTGDELEVESIGRVYVLAGKSAEAVPLLERAARQCRVRRFPLAIPRASYFLGLAREAVGDKVGACDAYAGIRHRWRNEGKVKSTTAELAVRRARALRCER